MGRVGTTSVVTRSHSFLSWLSCPRSLGRCASSGRRPHRQGCWDLRLLVSARGKWPRWSINSPELDEFLTVRVERYLFLEQVNIPDGKKMKPEPSLQSSRKISALWEQLRLNSLLGWHGLDWDHWLFPPVLSEEFQTWVEVSWPQNRDFYQYAENQGHTVWRSTFI